MKATELPIINFLQTQNVQFVIPVYQRNYDWRMQECKELLRDIISVSKDKRESHFIGSIVYIQEDMYTTGQVRELVIIDGQQRLTTINVLFAALYRFAKNNGIDHEKEKLYNLYLTNQYVQSEELKLKLKQTDINSEAFKKILNENEKEFEGYSNVIENFKFFLEQINMENFQAILQGLHKLIFVEVALERGKDDPQRIFESLNSTGLDLTQSDLIRNYILMDLPPKEQQKIFEQIWSPIEENARDSSKQKSLVSDFIRDYLTLRNKKIPNKSKVYNEFKQLFSEKNETYYQELESIKSLSYHYKKLINPANVLNPVLRKELLYISRLEINVAYPFLLQVFEDTDNGNLSEADLIKILKLIQSYVWRRFIVSLPTNALNKVFMVLYTEVDREDYYNSVAIALLKKRGTAKFPSNEEVKTALKDKDVYNIQSKNRNYLFELLENHNNREFVNTANEAITVEHIFPQTPQESWKQELTKEDYTLLKERYLHTLANLTLSGNNGALGNKSFKEKQQMNTGRDEGYNYSRLWLNNYLKTIENWSVRAYQERFRLLYERFLTIWEYPEVDIPEINTAEEETIFLAESPTHKRLSYFIFENTKIEEEFVARMYFYVLEKLYERNPQLLLENQEVLKISRNQTDFRSPQELVNGYYIETNIDSNSKFSVLKKLLKIFGLEDELLIKYEEEQVRNSNRHHVRKEFWKQLLPQIENTELFSNVNPSKDHWLSSGAGVSGVNYSFVVTSKYARIELAITTASKEKNKKYFKELLNTKALVELEFGDKLVWEELPEHKMSRIKYELEGVSLFEKNDWDKINMFFVENLPKFESVFKNHVQELKHSHVF